MIFNIRFFTHDDVEVLLQHLPLDFQKVLTLHPMRLYNVWYGFIIFCYFRWVFDHDIVPFGTSYIFNYSLSFCISAIAVVFVLQYPRRLIASGLMFIALCVATNQLRRFLSTEEKDNVLLHIALAVLEQFGFTVVMADIVKYSSDVFRKNLRKREDLISESHFQIIDIELSEGYFPRIFNIVSWLEKNGIISELKRHDEYKSLDFHILLLHTGFANIDSILQVFGRSSVKSPVFGMEGIKAMLDSKAETDMPIVLMFLLNQSATENHCDKDTDLVESILKKYVKKMDVIFVTNSECYSQTEVLLKEVSCVIKRQDRELTSYADSFLSKIMTSSGEQLKQRTGLYLERKTKAIFIDAITKLNLERKLEISEKDFNDIISELTETTPDSCDLHELEVCLERLPDVRAFGYEKDKITVYLNDCKGKIKIITTLLKIMPEIIEHVNIEIWDKSMQIQKYSKQGSKVVRSDDHYGTLGLFLKDKQENVYFTTCAHVLPKNFCAYDNDKKRLGKSVLTVLTSDMERGDYIDLSIVKVDDIALSKCQFGLRNMQDQLVHGVITEDSVIKSESRKGLPVFKWGATTGLTRGIYKGWIAKKNSEDRFDKTMHRIESEASQLFEEGDSGSLVCFEATRSPQLQSDSAAYIFVGKLMSRKEYSTVDLRHLYYCYHISNVFHCTLENNQTLDVEACLCPT